MGGSKNALYDTLRVILFIYYISFLNSVLCLCWRHGHVLYLHSFLILWFIRGIWIEIWFKVNAIISKYILDKLFFWLFYYSNLDIIMLHRFIIQNFFSVNSEFVYFKDFLKSNFRFTSKFTGSHRDSHISITPTHA